MKKLFQENLAIILIIIIIALLFRSWFNFSQVLCKGDCVYFFPENLENFFTVPYFWNTSPFGSGLGFYALPTLAFAPPPIILGFFYHFFKLNFEIIEKIAWFGPILIFSFLGIMRLAKIMGLDQTGKFFAVLFYLTNSYILLVLDGGQVGIALAYSLIPLVFSFFISGIQNNKFQDKLLAGTFLGILSFFDLRVSYLTYLILFSYLLFYFIIINRQIQIINNLIVSTILILLIPFSFHLFWIMPLIISKTTDFQNLYTQPSQVNFLSWMNLLNGLYLFQPHWPENIFGKINPVSWQFILAPLLVFLNLLFKIKNKIVFYLLFISFTAIFLIKGSNPPFGHLYLWLFNNIPGFNMFRDPSKFYILLSLSYSLLLGFSIDNISRAIGSFKAIRLLFLFSLSISFLLMLKPIVGQEMKGTFHPLSLPKEYLWVKETIIQDSFFSRSIWYPNKREFSYSSENHPALDATLDIFHLRPFDILIGGTYDLFSYLKNPLSQQFFDILGIKYIFAADPVKDNIFSESEIKDRQRLLQVLNNTPWLKRIFSSSNISMFESNIKPSHFFAVQNNFYITGNDSLYETLASFPEFQIKNLGMVFLDDRKNIPFPEIFSPENDSGYLVFNNKEWKDLIFSTLEDKYFISPYKQASEKKPNDKSWLLSSSQDLIVWRDLLAHKGFNNLDFDLGGGFVFADDKPQVLSFSFFQKENQKGDLYIRYFANHSGGNFLVKLDNTVIGNIETFSNEDGFVWQKIESTEISKGNHNLILENGKGFNAVNVFAFLTSLNMREMENQVKNIISKKETVYFFDSNVATKSSGLNFPFSGKFQVLAKIPSQTANPQIKINNKPLKLTGPVSNSRWYAFEKADLREGLNKTEVSPEIEKIIFSQTKNQFKDLLSNNNSIIIQDTFINPTKYKINVKNAQKPFTLIFSERYHPLWTAKTENQTFKSIPVYSIINEFNVPKSGNFDIMVEFTPQRTMSQFLSISLVSLVLFISLALIFLLQKIKNG